MRIYDIIKKKRDGFELSEEEINFFINKYTSDEIADYQASSLIMACFLNGMTDNETYILTSAMAKSGDVLDLSCFGNLSADKHSTGGVGDKTTLIVAPIVASLGCKIAKMSGRGLGHTGGTVDKLESIKGYKTSLSVEEFLSQVEKIGISVIGQTGNLAPADKKLYALRDVTATVDSIPLIASSIMSKKIAAGSKTIVLDVKVGNGAFMKNITDAEKLAKKMVSIGKKSGRKTAALLTNMDLPLGKTVGNSLEIIEAIEVLKGTIKGDIYEISVELATILISLVKDIDYLSAKEQVTNAIESGAALSKMKEWISYQGGDVKFIENTSLFSKANNILEIYSLENGYISNMDTEKIGEISLILGAGREKINDIVDFSAGIIINKKTNDFVCKGELLATLYTNKSDDILNSAKNKYLSALSFSKNEPTNYNLIYKTIY